MRSVLFHRRDLALVPAAYLALGLLLTLIEGHLVYFPDDRPLTPCAELPQAEAVADGAVRGLYLEGGPRLAVLYHGNAGNACDRAFYVPVLARLGYAVLLLEYPGYAGDPTPLSDEALLGMTHAVAAWVAERHFERVVLLGESLGAAVAAYHAAHTEPDRLVLVTPFASLTSLVQRKVPLYPVRYLLSDRYETAHWAREVRSVRILSAADDSLIPRRETERVYTELAGADRAWVELPGDHNTFFGAAAFAEELERAVEGGTP